MLRAFQVNIYSGYGESGAQVDSDLQWAFAIQCFEILADGPSSGVLEDLAVGICGVGDFIYDLDELHEEASTRMDWEGLGAVLLKFKNLSKFTLIAPTYKEHLEWEKIVVEKLPWLKEKLAVLQDTGECVY